MRPTRLLLGVLVVALLVAGGLTGGPYVRHWIQEVRYAQTAAARAPAAIAAWRQAYGDPGAMAASFARANDNQTATRLVALSRPLGLTLEGWSSAPSEFPEANAIGSYVGARSDVTAPPASVRAYLNAHHSEIASIVDLLTTAEGPIWKSGSVSPLPVPVPGANPWSVRVLNNVLAAEALLDASEGRLKDADQAMHAAWQVARSVREQPQVVGQLISMRLALADSGVVRQMAVDEAEWRDQLEEYDYPAGIERAIETDVAEHILVNDGSWSRRAFLADYLDGMRADIARLRAVRLTGPPTGTPSFSSAQYQQSSAPGTAVAEIGWPGFERAYRAALCTELDFELTDRVITARQERAEHGRWPVTVPDAASTVIAGARWVYTAHPDDTMSISLSRSLSSCPPSSQSFVTRQ